MDMYYPALITLAVLAISALIFVCVKFLKARFQVTTSDIDNTLDITKVVVAFVGKALKDNKFGTIKIGELVPIITDALEHIKVIVDAKTEQEAINDGLDIVKEISTEYGITISEDELMIIENIIKIAHAMYIAHEQVK